MKKLVLVIVILMMVSCQQQKIGYVDNVKLMDDYQEKIDVEAKYKTKLEAFNKKKDSISQAFQIEAQAFQVNAQKCLKRKLRKNMRLFNKKDSSWGNNCNRRNSNCS